MTDIGRDPTMASICLIHLGVAASAGDAGTSHTEATSAREQAMRAALMAVTLSARRGDPCDPHVDFPDFCVREAT
jgi:hypothetical protein